MRDQIQLFIALLIVVSPIIGLRGAEAAFIGNPSRIFTTKDEKKAFSLFTEVLTDTVYDRGAKFQADDMKVDFYGGVTGLNYNNYIMVYGGVGTSRVEEAHMIYGSKVAWKSDYNFTWLCGSVFKLYETKFANSRVLFSLDTQYRNTDVEADTITIGDTTYDSSDASINSSSMDYNDWHMAAVCSIEMGIFCPYIGIRYSDFESSPRVMRSAVVYEKNNAEAADNFGVLLGFSLTVAKGLYANIEAGFIDEEALSGSFSWRF